MATASARLGCGLYGCSVRSAPSIFEALSYRFEYAFLVQYLQLDELVLRRLAFPMPF